MKKYSSLFVLFISCLATSPLSYQLWSIQNRPGAQGEIVSSDEVVNQLSEKEIKEGWRLLFDGITTKGWRGTYIDHFPRSGWQVKDGLLSVIPSYGAAKESRGGSIITIEQFSDFELSLECKIQAGTNSGIKYFVKELLPARPGKGLGLEYQIWDDDQERDPNKKMACLYDLIVAENKVPRPIGAFNEIRIIAKGRRVEHWLNGKRVITYKRGSKQYRKLIALSKYKDISGFGVAERGHILLQDEGGPGISFRNIKIREL
jgi:hypothetical protein